MRFIKFAAALAVAFASVASIAPGAHALTVKRKFIVYFTPIGTGVTGSIVTVQECDPAFNCNEFTVTVHGTGV